MNDIRILYDNLQLYKGIAYYERFLIGFDLGYHAHYFSCFTIITAPLEKDRYMDSHKSVNKTSPNR